MQDGEKAYQFKNSATRGSKEYGEGVSTEASESLARLIEVFLSQKHLVKTGEGDCYSKYEDGDAKLLGTSKIKEA